MSEVSFLCKVTAIHPANDGHGNEYVCIEFAFEPPKPPSIVQMPPNMPQEFSMVMPLITQIPKMLSQSKAYSNRLVLYLTPQEWDKLKRKYQFGDEAEIKITSEGSITAQLVQS